jgi:TonB family protein
LNGGFNIDTKRSELKRRAFCFAASVLFHAALISVLIILNVPVSVDLGQLEVREAFLVSPEKFRIPENIGDLMRRAQDAGEERYGKEDDRDAGLQERTGAAGVGQTSRPVGPGESYIEESGEHLPLTEEEAFYSGLVSRFSLGGPVKSESTLPPEYVQDFSLDFGKTQEILSEMERAGLEKSIKQLKHPSSGFFNIGFSKEGSSFSSYGVGGAAQRAKASFKVEDYDLSPWAEQVVNKILASWIIPYPKEMRIKGVVGISAIINKDGEITSARVMNSSLVVLLDEAALKALKDGSPFPSLPGDFPDKSVEAYFEFHYGD